MTPKKSFELTLKVGDGTPLCVVLNVYEDTPPEWARCIADEAISQISHKLHALVQEVVTK